MSKLLKMARLALLRETPQEEDAQKRHIGIRRCATSPGVSRNFDLYFSKIKII